MFEPLFQGSGRGEPPVRGRVSNLELHDVNGGPSGLQFVVDVRRQSAQADTQAERRLVPQAANKRNDGFPNGHRIFTGLDIQVRHAAGPVMDKQFGEVVQAGAIAVQ